MMRSDARQGDKINNVQVVWPSLSLTEEPLLMTGKQVSSRSFSWVLPSGRPTPYICAECRQRSLQLIGRRQSRPKSIIRQPSPHRLDTFDKRRSLSTSTSRRALERRRLSNLDLAPVDLPIRKDYGFEYLGPRRAPPQIQDSIREKLRARSQETKKVRDGSLSDPTVAFGRIGLLPNDVVGQKDGEEVMVDQDIVDEYDNDDDEQLESPTKLRLEPGSLFHVSLTGIPSQLAVFIGMRGFQHHFFLADGRLAVDVIRSVLNTMALPSFITTDEINALKAYLPTDMITKDPGDFNVHEPRATVSDVPRKLSEPIMARIAVLQEEIVAFQRAHVHVLEQMYDQIADEDNYVQTDLSDVTRQVLGQDLANMSNAAKMAMFRALQSDSRHQVFHFPKHERHVVIMNPKRLTRDFAQVLEWARQYQDAAAQAALGNDVSALLQRNPLSTFIDKARRLIVKSRRLRSPTTIGTLGPSKAQVIDADGTIETRETGEAYSATDKMILEFLWNTYLRRPSFLARVRNEAIGSLILRAIGAYPNMRLERRIGRLLLQEMGSLAPWSEDAEDHLLSPLPGRRGGHVADKLVAETDALSRDLGFPHPPHQIPLPDVMTHLRKDWGDTEVICVDSKATTLIDDGVSLEKCPDVPDAYWVHVHVAHASAYIEPTHPFAQRAQHLSSSVYTTKQPIQMMPREFIESLNVQPEAAVLTISTLLAEDGKVRDIKITPGTIHRTVRIEPGAVAHVLGEPQREQAVMVVGSVAARTREVDEHDLQLARDRQDTLTTLQALCRARFKHRQKEVPEFANWEFGTADLDVHVSSVEPYMADRLQRSYHYLGDPTITVRCPRRSSTFLLGEKRLPESLVSDLMMLAGESAGKWLKERQIPTVYYGSLTHPEYPLSKLNNMAKGELKVKPMGTLSPTPVSHVMSNLGQYVQVTSPLRRFPDLLAQWQIDAALRAEDAGTLRDGTCPQELLPWTEKMVKQYIASHQETLRYNQRLPHDTQRHWLYQAFFRAFHFNEAPLPDVWDFNITALAETTASGMGEDDTRLRGLVLPFGARAFLLKSQEGWEKGARLEQFLPVRIERVDVDLPIIVCRAVGPPSDALTQTAPIHAAMKPTAPMQHTTTALEMTKPATRATL